MFSHKPSLDLIPQRGSGPPETPAIAARGELAVIGPMARSAADLALELSVLAGPDEMWDGIGYKLALPEPRHDRLADFRVLLIDAASAVPDGGERQGGARRIDRSSRQARLHGCACEPQDA